MDRAVVERRLRGLDERISLTPSTLWHETGAMPQLEFDARLLEAGTPIVPGVGLVLIYPGTAERRAMQPYFQESGITGPNGFAAWDGAFLSTWVGVRNVLVEVLMPGGMFGGRAPTTTELGYPDLVRAALEAPP